MAVRCHTILFPHLIWSPLEAKLRARWKFRDSTCVLLFLVLLVPRHSTLTSSISSASLSLLSQMLSLTLSQPFSMHDGSSVVAFPSGTWGSCSSKKKKNEKSYPWQPCWPSGNPQFYPQEIQICWHGNRWQHLTADILRVGGMIETQEPWTELQMMWLKNQGWEKKISFRNVKLAINKQEAITKDKLNV